MLYQPRQNNGVTLIELLLIILALAIAAVVFLSFSESRRLANLELCQTKIQALRPLENQCLEEIRSGVNPCRFCSQYNSQITILYNGACKDLELPPSTYTCPTKPSSDFNGSEHGNQ
ncbi:MAG: hypothetical protein AB2712_19570 [Candidatus Thiodiazotropha sp.]